MITITENNNQAFNNTILSTSPDYDKFCGAIIRCNTGYGNYIVKDVVIDEFTTPTENNYNDWYQIKDFQSICNNIKYIRPIKTTIHNISIDYNTNNTTTKSSLPNFYNQTVAKSNNFVSSNITAVVKNPRSYSINKVACCILTSNNNYNDPFVVVDNINILDNSLIKSNNTVVSWKDIFVENIDFSKNYLILTLILNADNKFIVGEKNICSRENLLKENNVFYFVYNRVFSFDSSGRNLNDLIFEDTIQSVDFSITEFEINNAINILKSDNNINGFLDFEYNNNMNLLSTNILGNDKYFNFVTCCNILRYKGSNSYQKVVDDFITNNNAYFNIKNNNTVIIPNMYQKYDSYNNKYRYVGLAGVYSGLLYSVGLSKVINFDYNFGNMKLLYYPTIEQRKYLYENYINSFFRKNDVVYVYGNKNIHNNFITLRNINQNGIAKNIKNKLQDIKNCIVDLKAKSKEKYLRIIVNNIEIVLCQYENDLLANSIQLFDSVATGNTNIEVKIYFKDYVEEIVINIDVEI